MGRRTVLKHQCAGIRLVALFLARSPQAGARSSHRVAVAHSPEKVGGRSPGGATRVAGDGDGTIIEA